jgi:DNA (cytosine-5)-methyltransferase 1
MEPTIRYIDLFCGTGGFSEAFKQCGKISCVYANDMVSSSKAIYELNHTKDIFELKNLNTADIDKIPSHDMICGGFPCQPFSIAGKRLGFQDPRANVFWTIMKIIKNHKPSVLMFENVKNLVTHDNGNTFNTIKKALTDEGYHIKYKVLDTCKITGIPHHRERIYILGFKDKSIHDRFHFDFPSVRPNPISDYIEPNIPDKYYYSGRYKDFKKIETAITKHINTNTLYQYRRHYVRENKTNVCPTLTANMGGGGHNVPLLKDDKGIRKLTPRECFNLQGFPRNYILPNISDSALYKLAGNAITVNIPMQIINKIKAIK